MSFVGSLFSNKRGAGFQPVEAATLGQAQTAYGNTQQGLGQQQDFVNALQAQGGLGNQANVFSQQQALADQLGMQAQGQGPNPALAQLQQQTGQNVANQASLMANQRGASQNAGLIARQAAQQGGNIQQQAVGQGAVMQAQQQLAAQQALQNQQAQMGQLASQQVGQESGALNSYNQAAQGQQQNVLGAINSQNQQNSAMAQQKSQQQGSMLGGLLGGIGRIGAGLLTGGASEGVLAGAKAIKGIAGGGGPAPGTMMAAHGGMVPKSMAALSMGHYAEGGQVDAQKKRAEGIEKGVAKAAGDNPVSKAIAWLSKSDGGEIPGQAKVQGDSYANDNVPAMLSPGEVVIPRHVMQSKDPAKGAAAFVKEVMKGKHQNSGQFAEGGEYVPSEEEFIKMGGAPTPTVENLQPLVEAQAPGVGISPEVAQQANPEFQIPLAGQEPASMEAPQPVEMGMQQIQQEAGAGKDFLSAFGKIKKGQELEAKAVGEQGKAEAGILGRSQQEMNQEDRANRMAYANLDQERQHLMDDIQNGHIDPNRFMGNMGTAQKVSTGIGLLLGGMGSGLTGGENPVAKYLDQQIENDIQAQKSDMGKKQNLLSVNMQQFGNLKDAHAMTKAHMMDMLSLEMKQAAAKAQDPLAKARLLQEAGKVDMQAAQVIGPLKLKQQVMQGLKQGTVKPEMAINAIVPEKDRDETRKELAVVGKFNNTIQSVNNLFADAKKISSLPAMTPFSESKTKLKAINAQVMGAAREMARGQGALSDKEVEDVIVPFTIDASDRKDQIDLKLKALNNLFQTKMMPQTPFLKQYGIPANMTQNTLTSQEQRLLNFAKQNPTSPQSQAILQRLNK